MKQKIIEIAEEREVTILFADGCDSGIVGLTCDDDENYKVVYSEELCISTLMEEGEISLKEAKEYFESNTIGPYEVINKVDDKNSHGFMTTRKVLTEIAENRGITILFADGYDRAIVGLTSDADGNHQVVYSEERCLEALVKDSEMDQDEAIEYFEFNSRSAYVGVNSPIYIETLDY